MSLLNLKCSYFLGFVCRTICYLQMAYVPLLFLKYMIRTISSSILLIPYFLMLIVGLTIPSIAYHGIFNPKSLTFVSTIVSMLLYFLLRQQLKVSQLKIILFVLLSISFLLLWLFIGAIDDTSTLATKFDQLKLFIITLTVPVCTLYLLNENKITVSSVYKTVIYSNLTYCTLKLFAVLLHLIGIIDIWDILETFGFRFMKMSIFGNLERLQSSLDISTPFILLFVLQSEKLGFHLSRRIKIFYVAISLFSNFLAFSRFLLFIYGMSIGLYLMTLSFSRIIKLMLCTFVVLFTAIGMLGLDNVSSIIQQRFFSKANYLSDRTRVKQFNFLLQDHEDSPYLGKGLGGFSNELIRDREVKHSYEVQWMAFLMQFGLFGISILLIPIGIIAFQFFQYPLTRSSLSFLCLFFLWIFSGMTNPFLISLQSGIIYTLFLIIPKSLQKISD